MTIPYQVSHVIVAMQMLIGELLFIYPYKKRKHFWIRFPIAVAVALVLTYFFPSINLPVETLGRVIELVVLFSYTIAVYAVSFKLKFKITMSLCSAGYALQHGIYQASTLFQSIPFGDGFTRFTSDWHRTIEIAFFIVFYIAFFFIVGKRLAKLNVVENYNNALNFFSIFVVVVCIILSLYAGGVGIPMVSSLYSIICCSLAIILQFAVSSITRLYRENENIRRKTEADITRYESAKDAIDFINIKCHDLKKELNSVKDGMNVEQLAELKKTVELYDGVPHTGNVIIDTVILNATLHQAQYGVDFSFTGNGEWLAFVSDPDLKALFMNAVSNASDAALKADPDKRTVSIVLEKKGEMVILTVRNYYVGAPIERDKFPETTKQKTGEEEHGFGLKSMKLVAKKYGGSVSVLGEDGIFTLSIYLMNNS